MAELAAFNREIQVRFLSGELHEAEKSYGIMQTFRLMIILFYSLREKHVSSKDGMQVRVLLKEQHIMPSRLKAGRRSLTAHIVVRIHGGQQKMNPLIVVRPDSCRDHGGQRHKTCKNKNK
jgi:hypothetical protein